MERIRISVTRPLVAEGGKPSVRSSPSAGAMAPTPSCIRMAISLRATSPWRSGITSSPSLVLACVVSRSVPMMNGTWKRIPVFLAVASPRRATAPSKSSNRVWRRAKKGETLQASHLENIPPLVVPFKEDLADRAYIFCSMLPPRRATARRMVAATVE